MARFSTRRLMLVISTLAACSPWLDGLPGSPAFNPFSSRWRTREQAASVAWLLGATWCFFTNILADPSASLLFAATGLLLGISWLVRLGVMRARPRTGVEAVAAPAAALLGLLLLSADLDFRIRLSLSEPALLADARGAQPGSWRAHDPGGHRVGRFSVLYTEEQGGCVLWTTGGFLLTQEGPAYYPGRTPPRLGGRYGFWHFWGPWWKFSFHG